MAGFPGAAPPFRKGGAPRDMSSAGKGSSGSSGGSGSSAPSGPPWAKNKNSGGTGPSPSSGVAGSSSGGSGKGFPPGKLTPDRRKSLAKSGHALPDGSFPITDVKSLKDATHAIGRAAPGKRVAAAKHIVKHARRLGAQQHVGPPIRALAAKGK